MFLFVWAGPNYKRQNPGRHHRGFDVYDLKYLSNQHWSAGGYFQAPFW